MPSNPKPSSNQSFNQNVSSDHKSTHNSGTLKTSSSRSTHSFPVHSNISHSSHSLKLLVSSEMNSSHKQEKKRKKKGAVSQEIMPNNPRPLSADPKPVLQCPDIRTSVPIAPHPVVKVPKLSQQFKFNDKRNSRSRNSGEETHGQQLIVQEACLSLYDQKKGSIATKNDSIKKKVENNSEQVPLDVALLNAPLTKENYKKKFQYLLKLEVEEHRRLLKERCDGEYNIKIFKPGFIPNLKYDKDPAHVRYGLLHGRNLNGNVVSHIKQASSETDNVRLHYPSGIIKAEVVNRYHLWKNESLIIAFTQSELSKVIKEMEKLQVHEGDFSDVAISFVLKRWYFDRLHKALENLSPATINRLIPADASNFTNSDDKPNLSQPANSLNHVIKLDEGSFNLQMEALKLIMSCQAGKAPVLVIGSFGTGKTRLLARAAYQILRDNPSNRVLICTHHQHCADTFIINYFFEMKKCGWNVNAVRLVPSKLQYRMPPGCQDFYEDARDFYFNNRHDRLIVTTFSTSFNLLHGNHNIHKGCFSHILLDEGAQAREPESIIPLCLADSNTRIIIAGDHKQVGPSLIVLGEAAIHNGLSMSL
uniref:DNA2/NAM7 helicase helicase domain-containing protein n=1 Tax=Amphimedon queenslandica TaxID=400682 RepID=A0A1X7SVT3_AMPQE